MRNNPLAMNLQLATLCLLTLAALVWTARFPS